MDSQTGKMWIAALLGVLSCEYVKVEIESTQLPLPELEQAAD